MSVDGKDGRWRVQRSFERRSVIPRESLLTIGRHSCDRSRGVNPPHAIIIRIGDIDVAEVICPQSQWRIDRGDDGGSAFAQEPLGPIPSKRTNPAAGHLTYPLIMGVCDKD